MSRGLLIALGVLAAGGTAVGVAVLSAPDGARGAGEQPAATATVERGALVETRSVTGTLGFGSARPVIGAVVGTVTGAPDEGDVIRRGQALYTVDERPTVLLYGGIPMYRALELGVSDGVDVQQLERNLVALGYGDDLVSDRRFTAATAAAVAAWQADVGLPATGRLAVGAVVFEPGPVRIQALHATRGARLRAGQRVADVTSTRTIVEVGLDAADGHIVRRGAAVTVTLPNGGGTTGRIRTVGKVAEPALEDEAAESTAPAATIPVRITLDDASVAAGLDRAPVGVELQTAQRRNVLSVPVEALLALRDGGYGVRVVEEARKRILPVQVGVFADGRVEVSGTGLVEGARVEVPAS